MSKYNSYIDDVFIDSAIVIRTEYLALLEKATEYQQKVVGLFEDLTNTTEELEKYKDNNFDGVTDLNELQHNVMLKISDIESKISVINKIVLPLNESMDKLRFDEVELLNNLIDKYPSKNEEDLANELAKYIE